LKTRDKTVGVVIPFYNTKLHYLKECLNSVIGQSYEKLEIILISDGNTEQQNFDLIKQYIKNDSRIVLIDMDKTSIGNARNVGIDFLQNKIPIQIIKKSNFYYYEAKYSKINSIISSIERKNIFYNIDYIIFLDSDDYWELDLIEECLKKADCVDIVWLNNQTIDEQSQKIKSEWTWIEQHNFKQDQIIDTLTFFNTPSKTNFFSLSWQALIDFTFLVKSKVRFLDLNYLEDSAFGISLFASSNSIYIFASKKLYNYRYTLGSASGHSGSQVVHFHLHDLNEIFHDIAIAQKYYQTYCWILNTLKLIDFMRSCSREKKQLIEKKYIYYYISQCYEIFNFNKDPYNCSSKIDIISNFLNKYKVEYKNRVKPEISIIVPSFNSKNYISECMESILDQKFKNIEVICVDAISYDGTLEILKGFSDKDSRVAIVLSPKKSLGYQINLGIEKASGRYLGIVDSDDYIHQDMYKVLYDAIKKYKCDMVKSDILEFYNDKFNRVFAYKPTLYNEEWYNIILSDNKKILETTWCMNQPALYNLEFIKLNKIRANETLGASYQDLGFWFQISALVKSCFFIKQAFYYYRQDNPNSSINSQNKVYCINEEYNFIYDFLKQRTLYNHCMPYIFTKLKFYSYKWNLNRINFIYKYDFLQQFSKEFLQHFLFNEIENSFLIKEKELLLILYSFELYYQNYIVQSRSP
ncbi:glycosyltransferase family 2 protein, partial [Campylobacter coli]|nr:glycosyltransferase family 2 protein [Campylobacter coli]EAH8133663.1 glycosyltransferase family 2 protein [Campylobacter coli]EAI3611890.1 glycosyltransferase family 2 protein [Campylobacter coli]EAI6610797.1 glycosyltransferase family 2 protein [Campylobacter coli]EAJ0291604.1 glycosyltransferase family 2 protein [Campylobacter coli]